MKFGVREITDIVFKATANNQRLGNAVYSLYDPILFFDSAKTSTVEGAVATVYAQGGRGNPRLLAWDGDKTVTFTFEDALMTPYTFAALSGADLFVDSADSGMGMLHLTEKGLVEAIEAPATSYTAVTGTAEGNTSFSIAGDLSAIVFPGMSAQATGIPTGTIVTKVVYDGTTNTLITISKALTAAISTTVTFGSSKKVEIDIAALGNGLSIPADYLTSAYIKGLELSSEGDIVSAIDFAGATYTSGLLTVYTADTDAAAGDQILVDFYVKAATSKQLEISAGKFAGYYYVEANTLFRGLDGKDYPAQFTIPKAKVQSNFTFTMAPTGDPSTFTFTLDAFPSGTRFSPTRKVLFTLDIFDGNSSNNI
jgi:hypothetical protein